MYELQDSSVGFIELFVRILVVDRGVILVQNVGGTKFSQPRGCIGREAIVFNPRMKLLTPSRSHGHFTVFLYVEFKRPRFLPLLFVQTSVKVYGEGNSLLFFCRITCTKIGGTVPPTPKVGIRSPPCPSKVTPMVVC